MQYTVKDLPKTMKEVRVEIPAADLRPSMERAAERLSRQVKIEGFRPGKASYEVVRGRFGEGAILEEALQDIVRSSLVEIIRKESLKTIGEPSVNVEKAAPGNDVVFTAKVAVMPEVKKLADLSKIRIEAKKADISDEEVERVIAELRKMQKSEHGVEREVRAGDKIVVDLEMRKDKVPVEGGTAKDHAIFLDEEYFVPGFKEKVLGMKKGETREFILPFPKEHFQKNLAGTDVEFVVAVKDVKELREPEADDAFAKTLGKDTLEELRAILRKNLEEEAANRETQRQELAVLEEIIKRSDVEDIPEIVVRSEADRMLHEFQHSIERQGMAFDDYLAKIGKKKADLLLDFAPDAVKRGKTAVLVRAIAKEHGIEAGDHEVVEEQAKMMNVYKDDPETQERIRSEEGQEYLRTVLRNRKVMEFLRKTCVKPAK